MSDPVTPTFESLSPEPPKRGPGRPKGSRNKTTAAPTASGTAADIRQAMATLDSVYDMASVGLLMLGLPDTATAWADASTNLRKTNEDALKASPRLARAIARAGSTGGAGAFFITHIVALASVMSVGRGELAERQAAKEAATSQATQETNVTDISSRIPGM